VTYTLVGDGGSDRVLLPILTWCLRQNEVTRIAAQWADFSRIPRQTSTHEKLRTALELYPCDVLFVHRDAEAQPVALRRDEIAVAVRGLRVHHVPVVPVRMTEAWLLADEAAIRKAAGNPNGTADLNLPNLRRLEDLPNPKKVLHDALSTASGLNARRRGQLRVSQQVHMIPNHVDDYSRLAVLTAFRTLQRDIHSLVQRLMLPNR
jgi:hypothetical protein